MMLNSFKERFDRCTHGLVKEGRHLCVGWPDDEHGLTHGEYLEYVEEIFENSLQSACLLIGEGGDFPEVTIKTKTFDEWKHWMRSSSDSLDDLGFSGLTCHTCGEHRGGNRYAVTALPRNPAEEPDNYIALTVCEACLHYIANGELPEE